MNELISSIIIAVVQGITEWLPVSSSGHISLVQHILNYPSSLLFDVALHFGTLMAVFVYFGRDISEIVRSIFSLDFKSENGKLGLFIIIATIPAAIVGFLVKDLYEVISGNLLFLSLGFAITGLILFISSISFNKLNKNVNEMSVMDSIFIGFAQIASLLPGISRSGITLSSGLFRNLNEKTALKFAFLMSIPIIFGANILAIGENKLPSNLIWATLVSFLVGIGSIHLLYNYLLVSRRNLKWFGLYALILSFSILIYILV